jgi:hypothetical protein
MHNPKISTGRSPFGEPPPDVFELNTVSASIPGRDLLGKRLSL